MELKRRRLDEFYDVVVVLCNGKKRADKVIRVVSIVHGTPYVSSKARNVEMVHETASASADDRDFCMELADSLADVYRAEAVTRIMQDNIGPIPEEVAFGLQEEIAAFLRNKK